MQGRAVAFFLRLGLGKLLVEVVFELGLGMLAGRRSPRHWTSTHGGRKAHRNCPHPAGGLRFVETHREESGSGDSPFNHSYSSSYHGEGISLEK